MTNTIFSNVPHGPTLRTRGNYANISKYEINI